MPTTTTVASAADAAAVAAEKPAVDVQATSQPSATVVARPAEAKASATEIALPPQGMPA